MGSTFKIFTTAMAFDAGTATMRSGYDATDPIRVARFVIRDYHAKALLSVPRFSCTRQYRLREDGARRRH